VTGSPEGYWCHKTD